MCQTTSLYSRHCICVYPLKDQEDQLDFTFNYCYYRFTLINGEFLNICTATHYPHFWNITVTIYLLEIQSLKLEILICLFIKLQSLCCRDFFSLKGLLSRKDDNKSIYVGSLSYFIRMISVLNNHCL